MIWGGGYRRISPVLVRTAAADAVLQAYRVVAVAMGRVSCDRI